MQKDDPNLKAWRNKMYKACPNPKVGENVTIIKNYIAYTYVALTAKGYDTDWKKLSIEKLARPNRITENPPNDDDYVYMSDGMYIHKDDAWW